MGRHPTFTSPKWCKARSSNRSWSNALLARTSRRKTSLASEKLVTDIVCTHLTLSFSLSSRFEHREFPNTQLGRLDNISVYLQKKQDRLTPYGVKVNVFCVPAQAGFCGGLAANVVPAVAQSIGHAVTLIDNGVCPESNTGEGSSPDDGGLLTNLSVVGSMAYCQAVVASNSRSTALGCWAF